MVTFKEHFAEVSQWRRTSRSGVVETMEKRIAIESEAIVSDIHNGFGECRKVRWA